MNDILLFLFLVLTSFYFVFLIKIYAGLRKVRKPFEGPERPSVTVIIPYRNESAVIEQCYQSIMQQDYPKEQLQVIFVDDQSTDDSPMKLKKLNREERAILLHAPEVKGVNAHKKRAVLYALGFATGEIILTTDADCVHRQGWIRVMVSQFSQATAMVSGPVLFNHGADLFGKMQTLEFAGLVLSGAGLIGNGTPVICNAANLAYRKKVFDEVGGFNDMMHVSSGDDELLMQKIAAQGKYEIRFCPSPEAVVRTEPNKNLKEFYRQRKRWASKSLHYRDSGLIAQLVLIFLFYLALALLPVGIVLNQVWIYAAAYAFAGKWLLEYLVLRQGIPLLYQRLDLIAFACAQVAHIPYIILSAVSGAMGNYQWKERRIKR